MPRRAKSDKQSQKAIEFACIERIAEAIGCKAVPEEEANQWPDGWLLHGDGKREPAEVVAAFKRPVGEHAKKGSSWLRHSKQSEAAARARAEKSGEAVSWYVGKDGFTLLDGVTPLPVAIEPIRQDQWVLIAVHQKIAKNYVSGTPAVLIVQLNSPLPLMPFETERVAVAIRALGTRFKFAALWVVNNYGDPPVRSRRDALLLPLNGSDEPTNECSLAVMDEDFAVAYLQDRGIPHRVNGAAYKVAEYAVAKVAGDPAVRDWIDKRAKPIVFVGLDDHAFTWQMSKPPPAGAAVIIFGRGVLSKRGLQAAAVLAHELGHVWLQDHGCEPEESQERERAADAKAAEWGFKSELAESLAADVAIERDENKKEQLEARVVALRG